MTTDTNNHSAAMRAIKATPIGESGQYLQTTFFRDDRRRITLICDGQTQQFNNDLGAAELVHINLEGDTPTATNSPKPWTDEEHRLAGAVHDEAAVDLGTNHDGERVVRLDLTYTRAGHPSTTTMILTLDAAITLRNLLDATFAAAGVEDDDDDGDDDDGGLAGLDSYDLVRFAKRYASLGDAVCSQLDDLLAGNAEAVNPNAVKLIRDRLGGLNEDIDDALESYDELDGDEDEDV